MEAHVKKTWNNAVRCPAVCLRTPAVHQRISGRWTPQNAVCSSFLVAKEPDARIEYNLVVLMYRTALDKGTSKQDPEIMELIIL